jgi:hypothetical protein
MANESPTDIPWVWHNSAAPSDAKELAVLLDSIQLYGDHTETRPRMRALFVNDAIAVTPVVHVQNAPGLTLYSIHATAIEEAVLSAGKQSTSQWVQLDFEVRDEQQAFYTALLKRLRLRLPKTVKLSITVQARWCDQPAYLNQLAADEIVPMFFRMGEAAATYRKRLQYNPESFSERCLHQAIGTAKQEPMPANVLGRYSRRYQFTYKNWQ